MSTENIHTHPKVRVVGNSEGEWGLNQNWNFQRGGGGRDQTKKPPWEGYGSGTTHSRYEILFLFQFAGYSDCNRGNCSVWTSTTTEQHKVNTYTVYTSQTEPADPVHYEMLGYDTLLGSHYDKYLIEYVDYAPQMPPPDVFEIKGLFF